MAYVIEVPNPFEPTRGLKRHEVFNYGLSIRGWLLLQHPGFVEFDLPTLCLYNGKPLKRDQWDLVKFENANDVVTFVALPQGPFLLVAILIVAVVALSIAITATIGVPKTPGELPASDPVFSNRGQQNTIRLGEPIEVCYGRNRIYPSLASRPFYKYSGNDQFQYSLYCFGQGQFDFDVLQFGDTDINDFQEAEYEIIPPGSSVTLFPTNVITSIEAGGQTLFAPNEEEYVAPGWVGPFITNPPLTTTTKIEIDIIYPKGLYVVSSKGNVNSLTVQIVAEAREIDDTGTPIGSFFALTLPSPITLTAATTTPQRRTYSGTVPAGRYEVRVRRIDTKDLSPRAGHEALWEGLRSFVDTEQDFGDVTLVAVKIRATNNLNDRTQSRFNGIATRMLPVLDPTSMVWSTVPTRGIVWALIDVFRANYGGRVTDTFLDLDTFLMYDPEYEARNQHFDWIFRDPITVWEAARTIARVGRATPLIRGSMITMRREESQEIPVAMFSPENILPRTYQQQIKFWDTDEFDSISIEYTEPATDYKQEIVLCTLPGGTTDHPQDVRLVGCQDRTHAYREGLFMLASLRYLRENITFDTGLEGLIISFGDLIMVSYDAAEYTQTGYIVNAEQTTSGTAILWLSEPLDWTNDTGEHVMMLRGRKGEAQGPYSVTRLEDDQQCILELSTNFDFLLDGLTEPMLFIFGTLGRVAKLVKVVGLEPQGGETVRVTSVNDAPIIHSFDSLTPSALNTPALAPQAPDLPEIDQLYITQIDDVLHIVQIAWTPAFGAQEYIVQTSEDGSNWQERALTVQTSLQIQVRPGDLWVRVAAINNGQGPWIQDTFSVGIISGFEIFDPWNNDLSFGVRWWDVLNASGFQVNVYHNELGFPTPIREQTFSSSIREFAYTYAMAQTDGYVGRFYKITVDPIFDGVPTGTPAEAEFEDDPPTAPTVNSVVFNFTDPGVARHYIVDFDVPHHDDLIRLRVWLEPVSGFDPAVTTPYIDEYMSAIGWTFFPPDFGIAIELDSANSHPAYYLRVAVNDVWGETELTTNISGQTTIPAFP